MRTISKGERVITAEVDDWYDCEKKETLLEANSILLNRSNFPCSEYTEGKEIVIIQPVKIGKNCKIQHSIIGLNVVIGDNAIIRNSIVGFYSELQNIILDQSIMGNDIYLKGLSKSLNIGDNFGIIIELEKN
ncbi:MAG: glucose-1-phosphate thymidylyltransferase [Flammeovirgaceae bacterium]|jgi:glucose-1-phosphate thymidylyltransferase